MKKKLFDTEELISPFKEEVIRLIKMFEEENSEYREARMQDWKKKDLYWHNIQYVFWAEDLGLFQDMADDDEEQAITRIVNIYKAHGESIIAAISSGVPHVKFFPDDAENIADIDTAKAFSRILDVIKKRNKINLLFIKGLWILYNQDFLACWNYNVKDKKYGTYSQDVTRKEKHNMTVYSCPTCDAPVEPNTIDCPECGSMIIPVPSEEEITKEVYMGTKEIPKSSEKLHFCGPLNVNIPAWLEDIEDTPYLIYDKEYHFGVLRTKHPNFFNSIKGDAGTDVFSRWARAPHYKFVDYKDLVTYKKAWITPHGISCIDDEATRKLFKKEFPEGFCATLIGDMIVEIYAENVHDHWTITRSPFSRHIHADSLGNAVVDIQDLTNDTVNLTVDTIEHGISEHFANPDVIDFQALKENPARPGQYSPAKAPPGSNIGEHIFTTKPAVLSREVKEFSADLVQYGQLTSGATPSIYGGTLQGSRTVGEYEKSRQQALRRLSTHYMMIKEFFVEIAEKAVKSFAANLEYDDRIVEEATQDVFFNTTILRSQLAGKVGQVEGEASETFPVSWEQKASKVMELFQLQNESISQAILTPQNAYLLKSLIGVPELQLPGEEARNKQWREIYDLVKQEPIPQMDPVTGMENQKSSIPVDETDNHEVEYEIILEFLNSSRGQLLKKINRLAYTNTLLHGKEHKQFMMMQQVMEPEKDEKDDEKK